MGLSLAEALSAGMPVLSSDLPAVREIANGDGLLPPGDIDAWRNSIERFLSGERRPSLTLKVHLPTQQEMAEQVADFYCEVLSVREQQKQNP